MSAREPVRLFVRCKRCGTLFDTGRVVSRRDLDKKAGVRGTSHTCRHCASESKYSKNDYIARRVA